METQINDQTEDSKQLRKESASATIRAENYVKKIIRDTTARAGFEPECFTRATLEQTLTALDFPELHQLMITLKSRHRTLIRKPLCTEPPPTRGTSPNRTEQ
jgi:hypothetical protein